MLLRITFQNETELHQSLDITILLDMACYSWHNGFPECGIT
jgi:hypothetical protein